MAAFIGSTWTTGNSAGTYTGYLPEPSPETEVDFIEDHGRFYIVKSDEPTQTGQFKKFRGIATARMSTDEILGLTREAK